MKVGLNSHIYVVLQNWGYKCGNFAVNILKHVIIAVFEKDFNSFPEKIKMSIMYITTVFRLSFAGKTLKIQMRVLQSEYIEELSC